MDHIKGHSRNRCGFGRTARAHTIALGRCIHRPMYSDDSSSDDSYVSTNYNEADTPVVNDSSAPSTMPSAALANLTGPDTPASSRPGPSGVSPVPASKRLRGWESDVEDDEV